MVSRYATWAARWRVPLGFVMALAFVLFSKPTLRFMILGGCIALLGLVLRALAAGYLEKGRVLATRGPYRYTRNPLYLGSFFMGIGFAVAGASWILAAAFLFFFLLIYGPVMQREEEELRRQFGESYDQYAASTSLFFPAFKKIAAVSAERRPVERFLWERYRKNHEYEAALGYVAGMVFLAAKLLFR